MKSIIKVWSMVLSLLVTISTSWVVDIQQAYDKLDMKKKAEYAEFGITFNKGLVLMLISPICYVNLRSLDFTNVRGARHPCSTV